MVLITTYRINTVKPVASHHKGDAVESISKVFLNRKSISRNTTYSQS